MAFRILRSEDARIVGSVDICFGECGHLVRRTTWLAYPLRAMQINWI